MSAEWQALAAVLLVGWLVFAWAFDSALPAPGGRCRWLVALAWPLMVVAVICLLERERDERRRKS